MAKTRSKNNRQIVATDRANEGAESSNQSGDRSPTPPAVVTKTAAKTVAPGAKAPPPDVAGGSKPTRGKGPAAEDYDSLYGPQAQLREMEDRLRRAEQEKSELAGALQTLCRQIPQKTRRGRSPSSSGSASPPRNRRKEFIEPVRGRSKTRRSVLDRLGRPSVLSRLGRRGNNQEHQERDAQLGRHHSRERERRSRRRELTPQSERRSEDRPVGAEEIRDIMEDILDRRQGKDGHE